MAKHPSVASAAAQIRRQAPRGATTVLVGPPLIYGDERVCVFLCVGRPGRPSLITQVDLGRHEPDPADDPLCQMVDGVLHVRMADSITMREARDRRDELAAALRRMFATVELVGFAATGGDLALAERNAELFPSPAAATVLRDVRAEHL